MNRMNRINSNYGNWEQLASESRLEPVIKHKEEQVDTLVRIRTGKQLVIGGSLIAILGIASYCFFAFSAEFAQAEPAFIKESLIVVAAGVLCWFAGAVKYISAAIDSDYSDEIF